MFVNLGTNSKAWLFATFGLIIITFFVLLGKFYTADAAVVDSQKFEDWIINCDKDDKGENLCLLSQQLTNTNKENKIEQIALYQFGYFEDRNLKMILTLPLGLNLQVGTAIITDNKEVIAPGKFAVCTLGGCQAVSDISDTQLKKLLSGEKNMVGAIDVKGQQINFPMSVKGLKAGLEALKK